MASQSSKRLREELKGYGVAPENVRLFGLEKPQPDLQDYLTLNALRLENRPAPDGVVEYQGRPVLYFVNEQRFKATPSPYDRSLFPVSDEPAELPVIFRQIACRGERAYLARVEFGRLRVAPVSPSDRKPNWIEYTQGSAEGKSLFSRLAYGLTEGEDFAAGDAVFNKLFTLLKHVANKIAINESHRPDAISLVGRALFFRFLRDRRVLDGYSFKKIAPKAMDWTDCFVNARNAADTCAWLDKTFNGDFLTLTDGGSLGFFSQLGKETDGQIFRHLSAVIRGHEPHGSEYQSLIQWDWHSFDFAHIPVGLLSQVYEAFSWEWTPKEAQKTSQRYTPRNVAVTLLDEAFSNLPDVANSRVLDPACGAGVFLVLAFRRLYLEHWKKSKKRERPNTDAIRGILKNQLVGLDISDAALKLAALSLYLTAIELDPEPQPPDKLRFHNLHGQVLHNVREPGAPRDGAALGSLGPHLGSRFDNKFDIVVSNPPWTSVEKSLGRRMGEVYKSVIASHDPARAKNAKLPDNNPDLPFLWKATQWCVDSGRIAMALPARILLKTEINPSSAREALFTQIQVDGVINGTNLSDTDVWPGMSQPWMLLYATNKRPAEGHLTYLVTIPLDVTLNKAGSYRIDTESARPLDVKELGDKPWLWKALSVGTMRDVDVVEKIKSASQQPLAQYWAAAVGQHRHGKGYIRGKENQRTRDAKHLIGLPNLNSTDAFRFVIEPSQLTKFDHAKVQWPRRATIYAPPLVLVKESPGEDRREGRGLLCFDAVVYNESFSGYSAAGRGDGQLLVRYLHLFIHSDIWLYYILMTSPQFGAERRRFHKADLEDCPIPPFEKLSKSQRNEVLRLSRSLEVGDIIRWGDIDAFFANLFKLKDHELEAMRDTLAVALPYDTARQRACAVPTKAEKQLFLEVLKDSLSPFVSQKDGGLVIDCWSPPLQYGIAHSPFDILLLTTGTKAPVDLGVLGDEVLSQMVGLADETGSTQIVLIHEVGLLIGIYNQYRYWTSTRARLLAGDVLREHLDVIVG